MQILFWAIYGSVAGWLTGKIMLSQGRDQMTDLVLGLTGGLGGGLLLDATTYRMDGKMIYESLASVVGAVVLTIVSRYVTTKRAYGSTS
jgi:uncharacterized membrane protein YeaQ/YmgE (transglycosylase-associated protein family)